MMVSLLVYYIDENVTIKKKKKKTYKLTTWTAQWKNNGIVGTI